MLTENLVIDIKTVEGQLVVDSRLVAQELGIEHRAFLQIIKKYEEDITEAFGPLAFEMNVVTRPQGGGSPERFYYLNEDQATFLMTLSRNTKKVVKAKINLVKAFSKARDLLKNQGKTGQHQMLWWNRYKLFHTRTEIPDGHWCVFGQLIQLVWSLEAGGFIFPEGRCVDISVGKCWNSYLRSEGYNANNFQYYPHHYPDRRGIQDAKIYPDELLPLFRKWLKATYVVGNFPNYVKSICTTEEQLLIASIVQQRQLMAAS